MNAVIFSALDDFDERSVENGISFEGEKSLTRQSEAEAADINVIVAKFGLTGQMPTGLRVPTFEDFEGIMDFRDAMDAVKEARDMFMAMPADVRKRFGNDPQEFVVFASDPANADDLVKLGLAVRRPDPEPEKVMKVEVVNPPLVGEDV